MSRGPVASIISTTTSVAKVRGFTVSLLFHLKGRELRTMDLVDLTGKYERYISRYLHRMRNYSLVEKSGSYWRLSEEGTAFLSYLEGLSNSNIIIRQKQDRNKTFPRQKQDTCDPKRLKQVSFDLWLRNSSLDDKEKEVVEVLVDHYNRTGGKFLYFQDIYELSGKFEVRPDQVNLMLMHLKQDHVVYSIRDRHHNAIKLGLYKDFIGALEAQQP